MLIDIMFELLFLVNILSGAFMTGLIWFIQVVQYPSFIIPAKRNFYLFHTFHIRRIAPLVIPVMILEMVTSWVLVLFFEPLKIINLIGLVIVIFIWTSTFFVQIPIHNKLNLEASDANIQQLIRSNWIRTILWSVKFLITGSALYFFIKP